LRRSWSLNGSGRGLRFSHRLLSGLDNRDRRGLGLDLLAALRLGRRRCHVHDRRGDRGSDRRLNDLLGRRSVVDLFRGVHTQRDLRRVGAGPERSGAVLQHLFGHGLPLGTVLRIPALGLGHGDRYQGADEVEVALSLDGV
ncbi:MAG: hypothetical protein ACK56F_02930, partial [bacterium]